MSAKEDLVEQRFRKPNDSRADADTSTEKPVNAGDEARRFDPRWCYCDRPEAQNNPCAEGKCPNNPAAQRLRAATQPADPLHPTGRHPEGGCGCRGEDDDPPCVYHTTQSAEARKAGDGFVAAVNEQRIENLTAEVRRLREVEAQALTQIDALHRRGESDLRRIRELIAERDQLAAEVQRSREEMKAERERRYDIAKRFDAAIHQYAKNRQAHAEKVRALEAERDQLKAQLDRLRDGDGK